MVIGALSKLQQGTKWEKISKIWRTATLIQEICLLVNQIQYMISSHIGRKGNQDAYYLANWGCNNVNCPLNITPSNKIWDIELHSLQLILEHDNP